MGKPKNRWVRLALVLVAGPLLLAADTAPRTPGAPQVIGTIEHKPISECSGIVASRRHAGVYWVHCDSGNERAIYAIRREGKLVNAFDVKAENEDWEDIAADDAGNLYIGDIGNNGAKRKKAVVHRLPEPDPHKAKDKKLKVDHEWTLRYPDGAFDSEAMFLHDGFGYLISKNLTGIPAAVYRFPLDDKRDEVMLEKVTTLPIHSPVTAADMSADGRRLAVLSITGLHVFALEGGLETLRNSKPAYVRLIHPGIEGVCFGEGGIVITAESREIYRVAEGK